MARLNTKARASDAFEGDKKTHEGAQAFQNTTAVQDLRRSVMSTFLWEDQFYEDGEEIGKRIERLASQVDPVALAHIALEARSKHNLRHVPLLLLNTLTKTGAGRVGLVANTIAATIQRPDELTEMLAIYWKDKKRPLSGQLKKGLARAFTKFGAYALAKYNRDDKIKLRDVLFLSHAKPTSAEQKAVWEKLIKGELEAPDTWEVALSAGADKKETFTRLIQEDKLGYFALIRNLRNMAQAGVDPMIVNDAIRARKGGAERILPFRFVAAARAAPQFERALDDAMIVGLKEQTPLSGTTVVMVDVSGSMASKLSGKSDLSRMDAAATLGSMIVGDHVRVFTFSNGLIEVPARLGMAGVESIINSQMHAGTYLGRALAQVNSQVKKYDRLIIITDEQSSDRSVEPLGKHNYMINVASYKNGVGYGPKWKHIDGFSESVLRWIREVEAA